MTKTGSYLSDYNRLVLVMTVSAARTVTILKPKSL